MAARVGRLRLEVVHGQGAIRAALSTRAGDEERRGLAWRAPDHLVISRRPGTKQDAALLVARFGTTGRDPFLLLDAVALDATTEAELARVCRHMITALLLRLSVLDDMPASLVAPGWHTALGVALCDLAGAIPGAARYPAADPGIIPLRSAAMTRRIARGVGIAGLLALDLRSTEETELHAAVARLFRARAPSMSPPAGESPGPRGDRAIA
jgi:hypothetical protein